MSLPSNAVKLHPSNVLGAHFNSVEDADARYMIIQEWLVLVLEKMSFVMRSLHEL